MPELPEVEHLRRSLIPRLVGRAVVSVRVHRRDVVIAPGDPPGGFARSAGNPRPRRLGSAALLAGSLIVELRRTGKQLAIIAADGRAVCVHLGMSGQLRWRAAPEPRAPHEHVDWRLDNGSRLVFRDPRRFGGVWAFASVADLERSRWSGLGRDALSITGSELSSAVVGSMRAIKAAMLDQSVIAGVGNIYADEALFRAGIRPRRQARGLKPEETEALVGAIRVVMLASIEAGGSTLRDYIDGDGGQGSNQNAFQVYGRAGLPCLACGGPLRRSVVAQRTTVMCPKCQR